jgi:putative phosphoesterase
VIGILSDAHGNRAAFDRAIEVLAAEGASQYVFLGDAVGYIPTPAVVDAIRALGDSIACVRGNHDEMLLSGEPWSMRDPVYQLARTKNLMQQQDIDLIAGWPLQRVLETAAGSVLFVHANPNDPLSGYIYPDTDLAPFAVDHAFVFMGHTHRPFVRQMGHTLFVNAGSCGLPRDHRGLGAAALFDPRSGEVRIVRFDIQPENRAVIDAIPGLHASVVEALSPAPARATPPVDTGHQ